MLINALLLVSCLFLTSCSIGKDNQPQVEAATTTSHATKNNIVYLHNQTAQYRSTQDAFTSLIQKGNVVVDFYADWCGPCKNLANSIEQIAALYPTITFLKVDTDQFPAISQSFGVRSIPALFLFKDGAKQKQCTGCKSLIDLKALLDSVYSN